MVLALPLHLNLVLCRHAGYSYSGHAAAWAYKSIDTTGMSVSPNSICVSLLRPSGFTVNVFSSWGHLTTSTSMGAR